MVIAWHKKKSVAAYQRRVYGVLMWRSGISGAMAAVSLGIGSEKR